MTNTSKNLFYIRLLHVLRFATDTHSRQIKRTALNFANLLATCGRRIPPTLYFNFFSVQHRLNGACYLGLLSQHSSNMKGNVLPSNLSFTSLDSSFFQFLFSQERLADNIAVRSGKSSQTDFVPAQEHAQTGEWLRTACPSVVFFRALLFDSVAGGRTVSEPTTPPSHFSSCSWGASVLWRPASCLCKRAREVKVSTAHHVTHSRLFDSL